MGEGLTEAEILKWYVQPGDTVTDGQVVCEVETAKAAVELPIPFDGVVHELRFAEGTTVDVGQVIITVACRAARPPRRRYRLPRSRRRPRPPPRPRPSRGSRPSRADCPGPSRTPASRSWSGTGSPVLDQTPPPQAPEITAPGRRPLRSGTCYAAAKVAPAGAGGQSAVGGARWPNRRSASWPRTWASI